MAIFDEQLFSAWNELLPSRGISPLFNNPWFHYSTIHKTSHIIDYATFGFGATDAYLKVKSYSYTRTMAVGDNQFSLDYSSGTPSGYIPIGIVGWSARGDGYTRCKIAKLTISTSGVLDASYYLDYDHQASHTLTWYVLYCRKNT